MKTLKDYNRFVESKTTSLPDNIHSKKVDDTVNESIVSSFFKKVGDKVRTSLSEIFGNKKVQETCKKDSWWYKALIYSKIGGNMDNMDFAFYPYSKSESEQEQIFNDIMSKTGKSKKQFESIDTGSMNQIFEGEDTIVKQQHPEASVRNVSFERMKEIVKNKLLMTQLEQDDDVDERTPSLFMWGAPGIAKTSVVKAIAKEMKMDVLVWHLSTTAPEDIAGIPSLRKDYQSGEVYIDPETGAPRTEFLLNEMIPTTNGPDNKGAILFLDEFNRANKAVLAACLPLILEGRIGKFQMPNKVFILAAGNRSSDIADYGDITTLDPTMMNRFTHYNLVYKESDYEKWAKESPEKGGGSEEVHPFVLDFLTGENKTLLHRLDTDIENALWPSPRSWTMASNEWMNDARIEKIEPERMKIKEIYLIFAGHIGSNAANIFRRDVEDIMTFADSINSIASGDMNVSFPSKKNVIKSACYVISKPSNKLHVTDDKSKVTAVENINKYINNIISGDSKEADMAMLLYQKIVSNNDWMLTDKKVSKQVTDMLTKLKESVTESQFKTLVKSYGLDASLWK